MGYQLNAVEDGLRAVGRPCQRPSYDMAEVVDEELRDLGAVGTQS